MIKEWVEYSQHWDCFEGDICDCCNKMVAEEDLTRFFKEGDEKEYKFCGRCYEEKYSD